MGLDVLHPHSALAMSGHLKTDIVAVHGLRGDALKDMDGTEIKEIVASRFSASNY